MSRIALLTHAKAGTQWIADVLSDPRVLAFVPHIRFKRTPNEDYRLTEWASEERETFVGPIFAAPFSEWEYVRAAGDKAIRVARDPRDTAVSWSFSVTSSHETLPHVALVREALLCLDARRRLMVALSFTLRTEAAAYASWAGRQNTATEYITTYERIVADERAAFGAMFAYLEWPIPAEVLTAVLDTHAFRRRAGGRERGTLDPYSHYRLGIAGDWRNHFGQSLGRRLEAAYPGLLTALGYEPSDDWWQSLRDDDGREHAAGPRVEDVAEAMTLALAERDRKIAALQREADARLEALHETTNAAGELEAALGAIRESHRGADARLAHFEDACAERADLIDRLTAEVASRDATIVQLDDVCATRAELIERLHTEVEMLRAAAEERVALLERVSAEAARRVELLEQLTGALEEATRDTG